MNFKMPLRKERTKEMGCRKDPLNAGRTGEELWVGCGGGQ